MKKTISIVLVLVLCMVAEIAKADFTFGTPTEVPNVNSSANELYTSISSDGLSLFLISTRPGGLGGTDIWVSARETTDDLWGEPVNLGPTINSSGGDGGVSISSDGLSLYFSSMRSSGYGDGDLWVTRRDTIHSEWGTPENLGTTVNSSADQCYPSISADELALYFSSNRGGGVGSYDIWVTRRETIHDPWGTPENLGPTVNSSAAEAQTGISADGRMLFFVSDRSGGYGQIDIWVTSRATTDDTWCEPVNLGSTVNSSAFEEYPSISADGSTLFFRYGQSSRWSGGDIWQAPIIPIVDFNADGIVDVKDVVIMTEHWGENYSLCDIGPTPLGDGIVDVQDLEVLIEYIEPIDRTLITHWALDEIEGVVAHDNVSGNDDLVMGNAFWQPNEGKVNGALEFDGINDYVETDFVLDPADGQFSVFAWIHGGAPGQVIISQIDGDGAGETWLGLDAIDGNLMTGLVPKKIGWVAPQPLVSESVITDGQWHRVGFIWDGSYRSLYVDGIEVAKDTAAQNPLKSADGGLYIGAGKDLDAGTFFSGLIDDVRIYNRAVTP